MRTRKLFIISLGGVAALTLVLLATVTGAIAQTEKVLHTFGSAGDGASPMGNLIFDTAGNLYGTTFAGGAYGYGTVFELSPSAHGWSEKILHSFNYFGGPDGSEPCGGLIFDAAGNLYGTTSLGGLTSYGTVFQLSHTGKSWTEKILHNFNDIDGSGPCSNLAFDAAGNLYGTTVAGGPSFGIVFELTPTETGEWKEAILSGLGGQNGSQPMAGVTFDSAGNFYGTAQLGGNCGIPAGCGVVFEMTPASHGKWKETVIHSFDIFNQSGDGWNPTAGVIIDAAGNVFGTTNAGGPLNACDGQGCGAVYELTPAGGGAWTESILHNFGNGNQGSDLIGGLVFDAAGNIFGTTAGGGAFRCGTVFELSPQPGGGWNEKVLFTFELADGCGPRASLIVDSAGNLYGTTLYGGQHNTCNAGTSCGTVFEIIP
jgi:uncharacterized repeat protein (TIGR03803 family)